MIRTVVRSGLQDGGLPASRVNYRLDPRIFTARRRNPPLAGSMRGEFQFGDMQLVHIMYIITTVVV